MPRSAAKAKVLVGSMLIECPCGPSWRSGSMLDPSCWTNPVAFAEAPVLPDRIGRDAAAAVVGQQDVAARPVDLDVARPRSLGGLLVQEGEIARARVYRVGADDARRHGLEVGAHGVEGLAGRSDIEEGGVVDGSGRADVLKRSGRHVEAVAVDALRSQGRVRADICEILVCHVADHLDVSFKGCPISLRIRSW